MKEELVILWTSNHLITAKNMVCMYARNAVLNKWWDQVTVIIWGASAELVSENEMIQKLLRQMMEEGVHLSACKACTDQLGVTQQMQELGIEVKYWGEPFTEILKGNSKVITI